ncbi:hypothetical protein CCACVL1_17758 [Corchorus capsularis]|uniref:Uncharacterized protein n=1 Tax=Corchorus capsularis TaxID=210143 RepID=A0A1R3HQ77_COCAP|nr:hypothetical protein CCACVL1_17758 [Corchorus capsularis]
MANSISLATADQTRSLVGSCEVRVFSPPDGNRFTNVFFL